MKTDAWFKALGLLEAPAPEETQPDSLPRAVGAVAVAQGLLHFLGDPRWEELIVPVFRAVEDRYLRAARGVPPTFDGLVLKVKQEGAAEGIHKLLATFATLRARCERTVKGAGTGGPAGARPDTL